MPGERGESDGSQCTLNIKKGKKFQKTWGTPHSAEVNAAHSRLTCSLNENVKSSECQS